MGIDMMPIPGDKEQTMFKLACDTCDRKGEIHVTRSDVRAESFDDLSDLVPCPACKGSGWQAPECPPDYVLYLTLAPKAYDWMGTIDMGMSSITLAESGTRLRTVAIPDNDLRVSAQIARYLSGLHASWSEERLAGDLSYGSLVERTEWQERPWLKHSW